MKATAIRTPVWRDPQHTLIDCEVNWDHLPEEWVPCTVNSSAQEHLVDVFERCLEGEAGPIAPFDPPAITALDISREHDRRVEAGCTIEVDGLGLVPLTGRPKDQTVILALLVNAQGMLAAGVTEPVIFFTDGDGADRMLTPAQMIDLARKGMAWVDTMHRRQRELKAMDPLPVDFTSDEVWAV